MPPIDRMAWLPCSICWARATPLAPIKLVPGCCSCHGCRHGRSHGRRPPLGCGWLKDVLDGELKEVVDGDAVIRLGAEHPMPIWSYKGSSYLYTGQLLCNVGSSLNTLKKFIYAHFSITVCTAFIIDQLSEKMFSSAFFFSLLPTFLSLTFYVFGYFRD